MKVNFLCRDSILAAPLVIEIARVLDLAKQRGDGGIQEQLGIFFKAPMTAAGRREEHSFPVQQSNLLELAERRLMDGVRQPRRGARSLTPLAAELGDLKRTARRIARPTAWRVPRVPPSLGPPGCWRGEPADQVALGTTADAHRRHPVGRDRPCHAGSRPGSPDPAAGAATAASTRWRGQSWRLGCGTRCAAALGEPEASHACRRRPFRRGADPPAACRRHLPRQAAAWCWSRRRAMATIAWWSPWLGTVVLAGLYGADPATVFLAGHGASPAQRHCCRIAGSPARCCSGTELAPLMRRLFDRELATLAPLSLAPRGARRAGGDRQRRLAGGPRLQRRRRDRPGAADEALPPGRGLHRGPGAGRPRSSCMRGRCRRSTTPVLAGRRAAVMLRSPVTAADAWSAAGPRAGRARRALAGGGRHRLFARRPAARWPPPRLARAGCRRMWRPRWCCCSATRMAGRAPRRPPRTPAAKRCAGGMR